MKSFRELKKTKKRLLESKKTIMLVHIYFTFLNKITITANFLAFFMFFSLNLSWIRIRICILNADPVPGGK